MTYKRISLLLSCFILKQGLVAQIVPPPATQTEVDAGVNRFKYVTPFTFANSSLIGGGGGTNTPGGATPMIQMNMGGKFVGTTNLVYDVTNSRVGLNIGANRPNSYLEIGGSGSVGSGIRVGSSTTSNTNLFDGGGLGMAGDYSMRLYMNSGVVWYLDNSISPYAIHPATTNLADIGTYLLPVRTNWSTWSVVKDTLTAGSVVTVSSASGQVSMQSATSGKVLAFSVPDTLADASINLFSFTSPVAGQNLGIHSTSAGVTVWTNLPAPVVIPVMASSTGFATNTIMYSGNNSAVAPAVSPSQLRQFMIPRSGEINDGYIQLVCSDGAVWGSAESWEVGITNLTQTTYALIGTLGVSNYVRMFSSQAIGLTVASNDVCSIRVKPPVVMTNAPGGSFYVTGSLRLTPK